MNGIFFINSILLGFGLAMDAFSVSLVNGLNEQEMKKGKMFAISGLFGGFQGLMPLIGWLCVHTILQYFEVLSKFIPWIAFGLLVFVGLKMITDSCKKNSEEVESKKIGVWGILLQGIATSIDALSVGFTIAEHNLLMAIISTVIIATITFVVCLIGVVIGKRFGTKLSNKATLCGGIILILIGLEILITSFF